MFLPTRFPRLFRLIVRTGNDMAKRSSKPKSSPPPAPEPPQETAGADTEPEMLILLQDLADLETRQRKLQSELNSAQLQISQLEAERTRIQQEAEFEKRLRYTLGEAVQKSAMVTRFCQQISSLDIEEILASAIEKLPHIIGSKFVACYFYNAQHSRLILERHNFQNDPRRELDPAAPELLSLARAMRKNKAYLVQDRLEYESLTEQILGDAAPETESHSLVLTPLGLGETHIGLLVFFDKFQGGLFDDKIEVPIIEQIAISISAAIRNYELFRNVQTQARTDGLTGLLNHSTFYDLLESEIERCKRYGNRLCLIMLDLDNFKQVNDSHGHHTGDAVLKTMAEVLRASSRTVDKVCRYGGDEFALLLPETGMDGGRTVAERVLKHLATEPFAVDDQELPIRCSIGLAEYKPGMTMEQFFEAADSALYSAKAGGKAKLATDEGI